MNNKLNFQYLFIRNIVRNRKFKSNTSFNFRKQSNTFSNLFSMNTRNYNFLFIKNIYINEMH